MYSRVARVQYGPEQFDKNITKASCAKAPDKSVFVKENTLAAKRASDGTQFKNGEPNINTF